MKLLDFVVNHVRPAIYVQRLPRHHRTNCTASRKWSPHLSGGGVYRWNIHRTQKDMAAAIRRKTLGAKPTATTQGWHIHKPVSDSKTAPIAGCNAQVHWQITAPGELLLRSSTSQHWSCKSNDSPETLAARVPALILKIIAMEKCCHKPEVKTLHIPTGNKVCLHCNGHWYIGIYYTKKEWDLFLERELKNASV